MAKRKNSFGKQKHKSKNIRFEDIGITDDVMFVCAFDLFGDNRSIYTFETICRENTDITLQDKRKTYFINIYGNRSGIEKDTVNLLDYFKTGEPTDDYTKKLQEKVEEIRCDDEWRENYMTIEMKMDQRFEDGKKLGQEIGRAEGEKAGMNQKLTELVRKKIEKGYKPEQIAEMLGEDITVIEPIYTEIIHGRILP